MRTPKGGAGGHCSKRAGAIVRIRGPCSVTATVCSKCAESDPSSVTIDHRSRGERPPGPRGDHPARS